MISLHLLKITDNMKCAFWFISIDNKSHGHWKTPALYKTQCNERCQYLFTEKCMFHYKTPNTMKGAGVYTAAFDVWWMFDENV